MRICFGLLEHQVDCIHPSENPSPSGDDNEICCRSLDCHMLTISLGFCLPRWVTEKTQQLHKLSGGFCSPIIKCPALGHPGCTWHLHDSRRDPVSSCLSVQLSYHVASILIVLCCLGCKGCSVTIPSVFQAGRKTRVKVKVQMPVELTPFWRTPPETQSNSFHLHHAFQNYHIAPCT